MKILELGDNDLIGRRFNGFDLHQSLRAEGIDAKCLVMSRQSEDDAVREYFPYAPAESFTKNLFFDPWLLDADVCHCHLMHNTPFDFNYLPLLSRLKPFIFTIHDPWLLGGHCVHHFECGKWQTGCFDCDNLGVDLAVPFDMTALNWRLKQEAFSRSDIALIVTSRWMDSKLENSPFLREKRRYHVPFGIDQRFFSPGDKADVRARLGIPNDNRVVMTLDQPDSPWKGGDIKLRAISALAGMSNVSLVTVGRRPGRRKGLWHCSHYEYGWTDDQELLRDLYRASDVYLMPSRVETFGMMAIEAMSCGSVVMTIPGTAVEEVVAAPSCGISVAESDFPSRLVALLGNAEELRERGRRSRQFAVDHYSFDEHLAAVKQVYEEEWGLFRRSSVDERLLEQLQKHKRLVPEVGHEEEKPTDREWVEPLEDDGFKVYVKTLVKSILGKSGTRMAKKVLHWGSDAECVSEGVS